MRSNRFSQLIRLFAVLVFSYFLASCGEGDGPAPVVAESCPSAGIVSFDAESYPSSATSALISVSDACVGRKDTIVNVDNGTESISIDLVIIDSAGNAGLKFGETDDISNTIAINEGDVITVTYADANAVTRNDTADITASTALSTLGVYSETNINPELVYSDIINKDAITNRFSQTVTALEGDFSLAADYAVPATGNTNGIAFTFYGLNNPTFEADNAFPDSVDCFKDFLPDGCTGWSAFEFVFTVNTAGNNFGPVSHDAGGTQSLGLFGPFSFDTSSGAYQADDTVVAGQSYTATAYAMNWDGDNLGATNLGIMQLSFWDKEGGQLGGGVNLGTFEILVDSTDDGTNIYLPPQDGAEISDWTELQITQTAPAGAVSAEIFLLHIQLGNTPAELEGSIYWDDVSLVGVKDLSNSGEDISTYESLKFGINTTAASGLMDLEIKMEDNAGATASVFLSNYTSLVVGDWALLEIPLSDFTGIDKSKMVSLGFDNASSTETGSPSVLPTLMATTLYYDDVHFVKADSALTGVLLDSPVEGVAFQTVTQSGITNVDGEFLYLDGEMVTFSVGGVELGTVPGAPVVTSVELTGSADPTAQATINQLVFLQSIDEDGNPLNGITISAASQVAAVGQSLDFTLDSAAFTTAVTSVVAVIAPTNTVVSETTALDNFYQTYVNLGGTDTFNWLFPGYPPVPAVVSGANTTIDAAPASIEADGVTISTITVQAKDTDDNNFTESAGAVLLSTTSSATLSAVTDNNNGTYTATVTNTVAEAVTITGTIAGNAITDDATVTFTTSIVLETLGVYSETNTNPVLPYSQIINANFFGGNSTVADQSSTTVTPLDGSVSLQLDFQDDGQAYGGAIFDFTTTTGGGGTNLLTNQSFELPDATGGDQGGCAGGDLGGWSYFNCNFVTSNTRNNTPPGTFYSPGAQDGSQLLKQFGADAGVFQTIAATPGETVNASAYAMSWSGDTFNNVALLQIFFLDAGGNNISGGFTPFTQVVAAAPAVGGTPDYVLAPEDGADLSDWTLMEVSAVAPAGAVEAKVQIIHILEPTTPAGGSLWLDDVSLSKGIPTTTQSFELPDASGGDQGSCAGGDLGGWSYFNCNYVSSNTRNNTPPGTFYSPGAYDGSQVLKQFGADAGGFLTIAASPGETVNASAHAMSWSGDTFNNVALLQIFFLDAGGNNISGGFTPFTQVVAAAPAVGGTPDYVLAPEDGADLSDWTLMEVSAVAPAGTVEAKLQVIHILEPTTPAGGSLWLDDVSLSVGVSAVTGGNITDYEILKFGIDTSGIGTFADLKIQLEDGSVMPGVFLSDYTPTVSANWNVYEIPLSDFTGLDKSNLTFLGFWNASSVAGAETPLVFGPLYFDDIHFVKGIPTIPVLTGVLVNSAVEGVTFQTATQSGITNGFGEFQYQAGEMVTFSIGDIILGTVEGADIITPVELTGSFDPTNQAATNLLVFLQSIDEDEIHSNGITISAATQTDAVGQSLDFTLDSAAFTTAVTSVVGVIASGNAVVSETTALDNFYQTYVLLDGTNTFTWLFPGYPQVGEAGYNLIWSDEFNEGSAPSATNWIMETGYGDFGWGNNEWQLYTTSPDNVRVEDGNLVITADCPTAPCGVRDGTITSARINTLNKFSFKYGKIKARLKPPVGEGAWPAFWMLGANFPDVGWPFSGEIDVMEMHNAFSDEFTTHFTMHWCEDSKQNPATPDVCFPGSEGWTFDSQFRTFAESLGNDFHIFEAEWTAGQMIGKIDGITYYTKVIDPVNMDEFLKEFFAILNVAMGGTLGSNNQPPSGNETWPQTMLVDYVRVYQAIGGDGTYTIGGGVTPGPNLLTNSGFESPDASTGDVYCSTDWTCFNPGNFTNNTAGPGFGPVSHDTPGTQSLKQFGVDGGAFQEVLVTPGETYTASAWAMNWQGDALNNLGILQLTFRDAGGNQIGSAFENFVDSVDDATNIYLPVQDGADISDWTEVTASGVAPAGAVSARLLLLHVLTPPSPGSGTVRWDDASIK